MDKSMNRMDTSSLASNDYAMGSSGDANNDDDGDILPSYLGLVKVHIKLRSEQVKVRSTYFCISIL